ncbi:MAG: hypothetical protein JOZ81_32485 [Chloroflexi bacterium]|nr:hypothetical protein [Chloroflexota bacterium]
MTADPFETRAGNGSTDEYYTWGRPPTTYLSALQYTRLLLLKARIDPNGKPDELRPRQNFSRPC